MPVQTGHMNAMSFIHLHWASNSTHTKKLLEIRSVKVKLPSITFIQSQVDTNKDSI